MKVLSILIAVFTVVFFGFFFRFLEPHTVEVNVWMPENSKILNNVGADIFTPIKMVIFNRMTVEISFENFIDSFSNSPCEVIVRENGSMYYISKRGEIYYMAHKDYAGIYGTAGVARSAKLEDKQLVIAFKRDYFGEVVISMVSLLLLILAVMLWIGPKKK